MKCRAMFVLIVLFFATTTVVAELQPQSSEVYEKETESFKMKAGGTVIIESDDGYIRVTTWNKDEVEVVMHKRAWGRNKREAERNLADIEIELTQRDDRLYIRDITESYREHNVGLLDLIRGNWDFGTNVDFEVMVPKKMNLDLTVDDGDVWIDDIEGEIVIDIDDGDVEIKNVLTNRVEIDVDDGDIELEDLKQANKGSKGLLFVNGDDNDVIIRRAEMETIEIEGDDGMIEFYDVVLKNLDIDLDDGEFDAEMDVMESGRLRIMVNDGDVTLTLPKNISAYFNLYTYGGRIRTDFPLEVERDDGKSWVKDKVGGGDVNVRVEVDDGYIILKDR